MKKIRAVRSGVRIVRRTPVPEKVQPPPPVANASALARLPELTLPQILGIWRNAIRLLGSKVASQQDLGRRAVQAIETEWKRRRLRPLNSDGFFNWPSTDAPGGDGQLKFANALEEGMLKYLDYQVGRMSGASTPVRHIILDRVFAGHLPPVFPEDYMQSWGAPSSAARLQKMAESLSAFARNFKRNDADKYADAIRDWEADLRYLHDTYYVSKFYFGWPATTV